MYYKEAKKEEIQKHSVFNYIVRDVGESLDAIRMNTSLNDLNTLVIEYRKFNALKEQYQVEKGYKQIFLRKIEYYRNHDMWMCEELINDDIKKELGIKKEDTITDFEDIVPMLDEMERAFCEVKKEIEVMEKTAFRFQYEEVSLGKEEKFKFHTSTLGMRQKEYKEVGGNEKEIPVYTAAANPVTFFDKNYSEKLLEASEEYKYISVQRDGDGTAGTNIILHTSPFYINTSRLAIEILDENIMPEYLYYSMKNIKKIFGFVIQ